MEHAGRILSTCGVGQDKECGFPVVGAITVATLADTVWSFADLDGGVVLLCQRHFNTPPSTWGDPPPFPGAS